MKVAQTPPFDKPGLRRLPDGSYEAYYVAQVFSFTPRTLTVPLGSRLRSTSPAPTSSTGSSFRTPTST